MMEAIGKMFVAFRERPASQDEAAELVRTYVETVADLPASAVVAAANAYRRGSVEGQNNRFAPSAGELRQHAMHLAGRDARLARLALPAPPAEPLKLSEEEQARRAEFAARTVAGMKAGMAEATNPLEDKARAHLLESRERFSRQQKQMFDRWCEARGVDPAYGISPALKQQLDERAAADREVAE